MKKIFAIGLSMLFLFLVVGCKKAEEQKPAEAPKVEAPAATPAPESESKRITDPFKNDENPQRDGDSK